jgi:predicted nucleic acid-binding protein
MGTQGLSVMPGALWLLDSNALMGYLNQDPSPGFQGHIERALTEGSAISVITWIEVLGWQGHSDASRQAAEAVMAYLPLIELQRPIVDRTVALRTAHRIKLPDAVIAASALEFNLALVTRNLGDFRSIQGLRVVDPYTMP